MNEGPSSSSPVYLDHAAATALEPEALDAMIEVARFAPAHPSASHAPARRLRARIERSRAEVAEYLGCEVTELRFQRSGSDALETAIDAAVARSGGPIASTSLEHPFVREKLAKLGATGHELALIPTPGGRLDLAACSSVLSQAKVVVLSKLHHELGTVLDFEPLWQLAPEAFWVVDAVQAAAWLDLTPLHRERVFVAASSYKLGGPPGAGALRVPRTLARQKPSGEQTSAEGEGGLDWIALVGFGAACRARAEKREGALLRASSLGRRLQDGLLAARGDAVRNGDGDWLGTILSVSFRELAGREVEHVLDLEQVSISRTSACRQRFDAGSQIVSTAYPDEPWRSLGATRWSVGWSTTESDVDAAVSRFTARFGSG